MVKEATTTRRPRPPVNKDGSLRAKPGKKAKPDDVRTDRLVLRVHPDLMELLTERARERGVTRSAYVEQLLVGWVRLDPRNRRVDLIGKYVGDAPDPVDYKRTSTFSYLNRAQRFAQASQLLLGAPPPREWFQDEEDYVPADDDPNVHRGLPDVEPPKPPVRRRR
jgi:hypothetical protein